MCIYVSGAGELETKDNDPVNSEGKEDMYVLQDIWFPTNDNVVKIDIEETISVKVEPVSETSVHRRIEGENFVDD